MFIRGWRPTEFWRYLIPGGGIVVVLGLILRSREIVVWGLTIGVALPILGVLYWLQWGIIGLILHKSILKPKK